MDKKEYETIENIKTHTSCNIELLARLIVSGASFLTLREKSIFLCFLMNDGENPIQDEKSFLDRFLSLTITDISLAVKRVFPRAKWTSSETLKKVRIAQKIMKAQQISCTCFLDSDYPAMLREMKDPPFLLFYRGNLEILNRKCVSVVGTRRASQSALKAASAFSKEACDHGFCVVSGLAFGIDGEAHRGAILSQNPATAAILPSGIDIITPHSHTKLAAKILERGGLIMSEYLPGTPSVNFRYVQRNRIVAALSPATVVIQAPSGSGAMITARLALDYNREVFFHKECFSREALAINQFSELQYKKKNKDTPQSFVDDGAAVIANFEEFKEVLNYG